jgi:hypothetical protein
MDDDKANLEEKPTIEQVIRFISDECDEEFADDIVCRLLHTAASSSFRESILKELDYLRRQEEGRPSSQERDISFPAYLWSAQWRSETRPYGLGLFPVSPLAVDFCLLTEFLCLDDYIIAQQFKRKPNCPFDPLRPYLTLLGDEIEEIILRARSPLLVWEAITLFNKMLEFYVTWIQYLSWDLYKFLRGREYRLEAICNEVRPDIASFRSFIPLFSFYYIEVKENLRLIVEKFLEFEGPIKCNSVELLTARMVDIDSSVVEQCFTPADTENLFFIEYSLARASRSD